MENVGLINGRTNDQTSNPEITFIDMHSMYDCNSVADFISRSPRYIWRGER